MRLREQRNSGLGLVEVLIVIATIGFLLVYLSMLNTQPKARASRINCVSNLKQVGLAMRLFANDHQEKLPWQVPEASGGTLERPLNDPTLQFLAFSNELTTPKILLCVDDKDRSRVSNFVGLSRANISYFIGLNASVSEPQSILSGDRNVTGGSLSNSTLTLQITADRAGWGKKVHNRAGNIGLGDGSAQQLTEQGLNRQIRSARGETVRFLLP